MADALRVLGQAAPAATTLVDLLTLAAGKSATISSVVVCNRGATTATFRLSVAIAGAADTPAQYLYYDLPLLGTDTFIATIGITMAATDKLRAYASNASLSFNVFGVEVS
jgi:hypothetical protein